ncbi:hypothetical protein D3C76_1654420 [compost metagenome]
MGETAAVIQSGHASDRLDKHQWFFLCFRQALMNPVQTLLIEIDIGLRTIRLA